MSWTRISALILVVTIGSSASAQAQLFGPINRMLPVRFDDTRAAVILDVDMDGDNDALTSNGLQLNDGTGIFADAPPAMLPQGFAAPDLVVGDFDGDGDVDILTATALYLNNGSGVFSDVSASNLPAGFTATALAIGDVDGDGDLDVLAGNRGQQNSLHLNDGTGVFSDVTSLNLPWDTDLTSAVALGDLDGDGDLDAVIGNEGPTCPLFSPCLGSQNRIYLNGGTGVFADATAWAFPADLSNTTALLLADMDSDGDLDVLVGNAPIHPGWGGPPTGGQNQLYISDGTGTFTIAGSQAVDATAALAVGDLNGDGSLDLLVGNDGQNQLYLYPSSGSLNVTLTNLPQIHDDTHALALGDVDADGDLDVLIGNVGQNRLYLNDGTGVFGDGTRMDLPETVDVTSALALGDVDGDGDLDAYIGNEGDMWSGVSEQDRLIINDGMGHFSDVTAANLPVSWDYTVAVALGDVDADGDLDALTGSFDFWWGFATQSRLYLNDGQGVFMDASATHLPTFYGGPGLALGDVDGDGDLDQMTSAGLYLNDGQGIFTDATATHLPPGHWAWTLALGDVDGDGDLDAFLGNAFWGTGSQNVLYLNDGAGVFTDATATHLPPNTDSASAVALGDVDGDGDLDAMIGNAGANRLYLNNGNGVYTNAPAAHLPPDIDDTNDVALGDVDDDGDLDVLFCNGGMASGQQNRLYLNGGTGVFTDATASGLPPVLGDTRAAALGDFDGDGDLDALFGNHGSNHYLRNLGRQLAWRGLPRFGQPLTIELHGPAQEGWILCASLGTSSIPVLPVGILRLDLGSLVQLASGTFDPQGRSVVSFAIPANPGGLAGISTYGQALVGSVNPRLSNLETFTFMDY